MIWSSAVNSSVPVVLLAIQLQTNLVRGLGDRVDEIIAIFQSAGYAGALLRRSLPGEHLELFESLRLKQ